MTQQLGQSSPSKDRVLASLEPVAVGLGGQENLGPGGAALFPAPQFKALEMRNETQVTTRLPQDIRSWEGLAAPSSPQLGELLAKDRDLGLWWENGGWPRD